MCKPFAQRRTAASHPERMDGHTNAHRVWAVDVVNAAAHMALAS